MTKLINAVEMLANVYGKESVAKTRKTAIINKLNLGLKGSDVFMVEDEIARKMLAHITDGKGKYRAIAEELLMSEGYKAFTTEYVNTKKRAKTMKEVKAEYETIIAELKAEVERLKEKLGE